MAEDEDIQGDALELTASIDDIATFTANVFTEDVDAFENRIEELALDVGIAFDNMTGNGEVDLLYTTSISFLIFITVAIISGLISYKQSKYRQLGCRKHGRLTAFYLTFFVVRSGEAADQRKQKIAS